MEKSVRIDGKNIMPELLKDRAIVGSSIIEDLILASSNKLRDFLLIEPNRLIKGPMQKCVTRKDPSLDNYCADLFLRTCFEPMSDLPIFEEHIIRDAETTLSSEMNPRLYGAILIGIGGQSKNPDFAAVYDEHNFDGTRVVNSATQVIIDRHLKDIADQKEMNRILPFISTLNKIDAEGGTTYDSLFSFTKNLHNAQFKQPGFVLENLAPQWKQAIIESILTSVLTNISALDSANESDFESAARVGIDNYLFKRANLVDQNFLERLDQGSIKWVVDKLLGTPKQERNYFSFAEICLAVRNTWDEKICSLIISFILESAFQLQEEFVNFESNDIQERIYNRRYSFIYYEMKPRDMLPHKPILAKLNKEQKRGMVVIYDPFRQTTMVCKSNFLFVDSWRKIVDKIREVEPDDRWYIPVHDDGGYGNFLLNGTKYFVGVKMTELKPDNFFEIFKYISQ